MAVTLVLGASLQFIWALINTLQLIIRVPLFPLANMPMNAQLFFSTLVSISSFDLLPTDYLNGVFFSYNEDDESDSGVAETF
jgi:hypothetical protein